MSPADLASAPVTVITIPVESSTTTGSVPAVTSTAPAAPTTTVTETTVAATTPPASEVQPDVFGLAAAAALALSLLVLLVRSRRRPKPPPAPTLTERVRDLSRNEDAHRTTSRSVTPVRAPERRANDPTDRLTTL